METNFSKTKQKYSYNGILDANHFLMAENAALKESNSENIAALKIYIELVKQLLPALGNKNDDQYKTVKGFNDLTELRIAKSEATKA